MGSGPRLPPQPRHPATPIIARREGDSPNYYLDWAFHEMRKLVDTFPKSITDSYFIVRTSIDNQLEKRGKGIVLLHDSHRNTAEALPELLRQLRLTGYKVVHMVPKEQLTTIPKYDEMFDHRENVSSSPQPGSASATGYVTATYHRRSMYMHVPLQRSTMHTHKKDDQKIPANGGY